MTNYFIDGDQVGPKLAQTWFHAAYEQTGGDPAEAQAYWSRHKHDEEAREIIADHGVEIVV